jgi:hypothetical protein
VPCTTPIRCMSQICATQPKARPQSCDRLFPTPGILASHRCHLAELGLLLLLPSTPIFCVEISVVAQFPSRMAELVAFGASIVAFIHLAGRVIELSKFYLEGLQDCPHDIRVILVEVSSLKAILQTLSYLIGTSSGASQSPGLLQQLSGKDGPVEGCREAIASLEKLLPPHSRTAVRKRRKLDTVRSQLAWPLKQSHAKKLLDEIMRYKTSISFALTSETA